MFTDVMPSEQLDAVGNDDILAAVAVAYTHENAEGFTLKQFKEYRGKPRRARMALRLLSALEADHFTNLRVIGGLSPARHVVENGQRVLGFLDSDTYSSLPPRRAQGFAWYSMVLGLMSTGLGSYANQLGKGRAEFLLDPLPGDTPGSSTPGMDLMHRIAVCDAIRPMWKQSKERGGMENIGFAYATLPGDPDGDIRAVKKSTHSVLADWFAHACHAAANHREFRSQGWTEDQRIAIADPLLYLVDRNHATVIDLGGSIRF